MEATPVLSSHTVRLVEQEYARSHGGHCYTLMERAGAGVLRRLLKAVPHPHLVWIFAGKGNNGGDGYVVARLLKEQGIAHRVFAVGKPHPGTEANAACENFRQAGGFIEYGLPEDGATRPDAIVDALLGTGIDSAPRAPFDEWILFINRTHAFTLSIDVPSGLNADSGQAPGDCVSAQLTVAALALKPGLFTGQAPDYCGQVVLEDLGLNLNSDPGLTELISRSGQLPMLQRTYEEILDDLPVRQPSSHKGDAGRVLIIGGAEGYGGAAVLASMAALRAGAGLVKAVIDPVNIPALNAACPEIMTADASDASAVSAALNWADCIAIGPGLGQSEAALSLVKQVMAQGKSTVYDADALNLMARHQLRPEGSLHILTPHPGEAARLLGQSVPEINADRLDSARRLQDRYGGCVLLKGAGSIICDGRRLNIIREGSPAMASGGMGDVLTGLTAAFLAQGLAPKMAILAAACVHGRAGALAGQSGIIGTAASDLLPFIRRLVNKLPAA